MTLLLGTGIRVSECVGLNLNDVDLDNGALVVHRKGGYDATIYFGFEVETALGFLYFSQKECDLVVLETGMGGKAGRYQCDP